MANEIPGRESVEAYRLILENSIFSSEVYLQNCMRTLNQGYDTPSNVVAALQELEDIPGILSNLGYVNLKDYERLRDDFMNLSFVLKNRGNEEASGLSMKLALDNWLEAEKLRSEFMNSYPL